MTMLGIPRLFLFACFLTVLLFVGRAEANLVWHWSGDCTTPFDQGKFPLLCTHATFDAVTTDDYVPGTLQGIGTTQALLEAFYQDDTGASTASYGLIFGGGADSFEFPAVDGAAFGFVNAQVTTFQSRADGTWRFESESAYPGCNASNAIDPLGNPNCSYGMMGINGTWTVPTPATLGLVALGLLLVLAAPPRYRRRKLDRTVPAD